LAASTPSKRKRQTGTVVESAEAALRLAKEAGK